MWRSNHLSPQTFEQKRPSVAVTVNSSLQFRQWRVTLSSSSGAYPVAGQLPRLALARPTPVAVRHDRLTPTFIPLASTSSSISGDSGRTAPPPMT